MKTVGCRSTLNRQKVGKMLRPFIKNYNMYEIPNTRNCFKVEIKQENKKPMYLCCYKKIVINQYQNNTEQISKKMYNKTEALIFVLEKYNEYLSQKKESEDLND
jgi:hypothetical protein